MTCGRTPQAKLGCGPSGTSRLCHSGLGSQHPKLYRGHFCEVGTGRPSTTDPETPVGTMARPTGRDLGARAARAGAAACTPCSGPSPGAEQLQGWPTTCQRKHSSWTSAGPGSAE